MNGSDRPVLCGGSEVMILQRALISVAREHWSRPTVQLNRLDGQGISARNFLSSGDRVIQRSRWNSGYGLRSRIFPNSLTPSREPRWVCVLSDK